MLNFRTSSTKSLRMKDFVFHIPMSLAKISYPYFDLGYFFEVISIEKQNFNVVISVSKNLISKYAFSFKLFSRLKIMRI